MSKPFLVDSTRVHLHGATGIYIRAKDDVDDKFVNADIAEYLADRGVLTRTEHGYRTVETE